VQEWTWSKLQSNFILMGIATVECTREAKEHFERRLLQHAGIVTKQPKRATNSSIRIPLAMSAQTSKAIVMAIKTMIRGIQSGARQQRDDKGRTPWFYLFELMIDSGHANDNTNTYSIKSSTTNDSQILQEIGQLLLQSLGKKLLLEPADIQVELLPLHMALSMGNTCCFEWIQWLLEACPEAALVRTKSKCSVWSSNKSGGELPLHLACRVGGVGRHDVRLLQLLHDTHPAGSQCRNTAGETPLSLMCQQSTCDAQCRAMSTPGHINSQILLRQRFEASLIFVFQMYPNATTLTTHAYGESPLHHIMEAVVKGRLYFPPRVWKTVIHTYPALLWQCDRHLNHCPPMVWIKFLTRHDAVVSGHALTLMKIVMEVLLRKVNTTLSYHGTEAQILETRHILAFVVAAFGGNHQHDACLHALTNVLGPHQQNTSDCGESSTTMLHTFAQGVGCWYSCHLDTLSSSHYTFRCNQPLNITTSTRRELLQHICDLNPRAGYVYDTNGHLPLHALLCYGCDLNNKISCSTVYFQDLCQVMMQAFPTSAAMPIVAMDKQLNGLYPFMVAALKNDASWDTQREFHDMQWHATSFILPDEDCIMRDQTNCTPTALNTTFALMQGFTTYCNMAS
jgi:hypothetical protein